MILLPLREQLILNMLWGHQFTLGQWSTVTLDPRTDAPTGPDPTDLQLLRPPQLISGHVLALAEPTGLPYLTTLTDLTTPAARRNVRRALVQGPYPEVEWLDSASGPVTLDLSQLRDLHADLRGAARGVLGPTAPKTLRALLTGSDLDFYPHAGPLTRIEPPQDALDAFEQAHPDVVTRISSALEQFEGAAAPLTLLF